MVIQKDKVRSHIVTVASKIFTRFGFRKTTMEEIAMASKKGKSSIYYYFESKEDIFKAVVEKEATELKNELNKIISKIDDPVEKLKIFILFRRDKLSTMTNFYAALKHDNLNHLEFIKKIRSDYDKNEIKILKSILQIGMDQGKFIIDDPELQPGYFNSNERAWKFLFLLKKNMVISKTG